MRKNWSRREIGDGPEGIARAELGASRVAGNGDWGGQARLSFRDRVWYGLGLESLEGQTPRARSQAEEFGQQGDTEGIKPAPV